MKKSKLAIASFILSLLPIIIPILILGAVVIDDAFNPSTGQVFSYVFFSYIWICNSRGYFGDYCFS